MVFCEYSVFFLVDVFCVVINSCSAPHSTVFLKGPQNVVFGSCQERTLFPYHCAPDRMGNELSLKGCPHRGPGCYDNHTVGTIVYELEKRPLSKKGYILAARTAARFLPPAQTNTPSPQKYQNDWSCLKLLPPCKPPFSSSTQRFMTQRVTLDSNPGPGLYAHDAPHTRKVSWPMRFGPPDWTQVPMLKRRSLRTELISDKEFRKQRNRVAYLHLYYS
uniref:Primary cilia formation n=1 Tax=Paramormyrops kingsleyae TaxID=1676925 RepID=A0A3B3T3N6_9TELE|nr:protein pitchfork isoform X1 [Paramormyrops kingsleyae]